MADEQTVPLELEHALRHVEAARDEWASGHHHMAAMHLREAITDGTWSLYQLYALTDTALRES